MKTPKTKIRLETRCCICGCKQTYRCLPTSKQQYFSHFCAEKTLKKEQNWHPWKLWVSRGPGRPRKGEGPLENLPTSELDLEPEEIEEDTLERGLLPLHKFEKV